MWTWPLSAHLEVILARSQSKYVRKKPFKVRESSAQASHGSKGKKAGGNDNVAVQQTSVETEERVSVENETSPKRKRSMIVYVHNVSPRERNRKDTLDYSSLTLKMSEHLKEAVCFSKTKRNILIERQTKKTAIEITNHTISSDGKLFINDMTQLSDVRPGDFFFQYKDIVESFVCTIDNIVQEAQQMDLVNFRTKVVSKGPKETVHGKNLQLAECVVADTETSLVKLVLWEEHIDVVEENRVYTLTK